MIVIFGIHSGLKYLSGILGQVILVHDIQNKVMGSTIGYNDIRDNQYFSEIIGTDHTERLRKELKDKPLPKR